MQRVEVQDCRPVPRQRRLADAIERIGQRDLTPRGWGTTCAHIVVTFRLTKPIRLIEVPGISTLNDARAEIIFGGLLRLLVQGIYRRILSGCLLFWCRSRRFVGADQRKRDSWG